MTNTILVVDDEAITLNNIDHILTKEGYKVVPVDNGRKAIELLEAQSFDLVISDYKMEKVDGMQILAKSKELHPLTEVIMITGYATVDLAVKSMQNGAYYYLAKPFKIDELRSLVKEALLKKKLQTDNYELKNKLKNIYNPSPLIGQSKVMIDLIAKIKQIALSDSNVLILGESGTGKELVAKEIHKLSPRANKKFVAFNCGSFTNELISNELFGHEKNAFTGAGEKKEGLIESANGGTVFLDEIGDMPLPMQIKLLRVIQEKEIIRVGGTSPIQVDVRFISATHRDLKKEIENKTFRQDLYYRTNIISLHIPTLIERVEDIPILINHFLKIKSKLSGKKILGIDKSALNLLSQYNWPGNVRELENVIERSVAMSTDNQLIRIQDLPDYLNNFSLETYYKNNLKTPTIEEQEKNYIKWILEKCEWNQTKAAQVMNIDRVSLWRKIKRFSIKKDDN